MLNLFKEEKDKTIIISEEGTEEATSSGNRKEDAAMKRGNGFTKNTGTKSTEIVLEPASWNEHSCSYTFKEKSGAAQVEHKPPDIQKQGVKRAKEEVALS